MTQFARGANEEGFLFRKLREIIIVKICWEMRFTLAARIAYEIPVERLRHIQAGENVRWEGSHQLQRPKFPIKTRLVTPKSAALDNPLPLLAHFPAAPQTLEIQLGEHASHHLIGKKFPVKRHIQNLSFQSSCCPRNGCTRRACTPQSYMPIKVSCILLAPPMNHCHLLPTNIIIEPSN